MRHWLNRAFCDLLRARAYGSATTSTALQIGQGAPAPQQPPARSPNHGLSVWFSPAAVVAT
jgi:hypothetical protein